MKERANLIYTILFRNGKYHRHIVTAENVFEVCFFIAILHESFENVKGSLLIEKLFTILTIISPRG